MLGVSGVSGDMRAVKASNTPEARRAIDLYVYGIGQQFDSMTASLGELDAVILTAGMSKKTASLSAAKFANTRAGLTLRLMRVTTWRRR